MSDIKIGDRIKLKSNIKGVVKFIGEIHVSKGVFYGVELDTPDGKTNGSLNNVTYFICKEKHGLFARYSQLIKFDEGEESMDIHAIPKLDSSEEVYKVTQLCEKNQESPVSEMSISMSSNLNTLLNIPKNEDAEVVDTIDKENKTIVKSGLPVFSKASTQKNKNPSMNIVPSKSPLIEKHVANVLEMDIQRDYAVISTTKTSSTMRMSQSVNTCLLTSNIPTNKSDINNPEKTPACQRCSELEIDCEEKIETFKILKKKDRNKIVLLEKRNADLVEKVSELSQMLDTIKEERENVTCEFNNYREMMQSAEEDIESITMDKELAEENCEGYRQELEQLKIQFDQLTDENRVLMNNKEDGYLKDENCPIINKYRNAIIELKNIIDTLKVDNAAKVKELELSLERQLCSEIETETMRIENLKFQDDIREMKELVDSTSDVIQIVDNLTEKNQYLESQVATLESRVLELDELCDMTSLEVEDKCRELRTLRAENATLSHCVETFRSEISVTICKQSEQNELCARFREKIQGLENEIVILRSELQSKKDSRDNDRRYTIVADRQKHSIYSDASKMISDKLKDLELRQKVQLVDVMERFLSETFTMSDGHRAMLDVVLMVDRFWEKISIILTYIEEKKRIVDSFIYNKKEIKTFHKKLEFLLLFWSQILHQSKRNLYQCELAQLGSITSHNSSLKSHEQRIDIILSWIQKDCFDESRNLKDLEVSVEFFRSFFKAAFLSPSVDSSQTIGDFVRVINIGSQCLDSCMQWIVSIVASKCYENARFKDLTEYMTTFIAEIQSKVLGMYKHLKHLPHVHLSSSCVQSMDDAVLLLCHLIESVTRFCDEMSTDKIVTEDTMARLLEIFGHCFKYTSTDIAKHVIVSMTQIRITVVEMATSLDNGLYDIDSDRRDVGSDRSTNIVDKSVQRHREHVSHLRGLVHVVQLKEVQIQQLNIALVNQSEKLKDSTLNMEYVKSKMTKVVQKKNEEEQLLHNKLLDALEDINSKENTIASLEKKISLLKDRISTLESAPVDITRIERNDGNNKEGLVTEIRILKSTMSTLYLKMNHLRYQHLKAQVGDLESLRSVKSRQRTITDGYLEKAQSISYDIFERLSAIEIPSLSTNISSYNADKCVASANLKRKVDSLGDTCLTTIKKVSVVI